MTADAFTINANTLTLPEAVTIFEVAAIHKALAAHDLTGQLLLDFSATKEIDGAGSQLLLMIKRLSQKASAELRVVNVQEDCAELMRLFSLPAPFTQNGEAS